MDDFRSSLLTLRDDAFFEIVRNYLGPVKTPFNKHDLIARLERFLRSEGVQERILELIDDDDAEILTAVWLLGEPDFDEMHLFFAANRSYLDLHQRLLNLEDRLLVYRSNARLRINPVLSESLERRVLRPDRLFISRPRTPADPLPKQGWLSDTLLLSFYAYLHEAPELFRADRSVRKRALADLRDRLPATVEPLSNADSTPRVASLVDLLAGVGAVDGDARLLPDCWARLAGYSPLGRLATLVAASSSGDRARTDALAESIEAVLTCLPRGRAMAGLSVERLLLVVAPDHDLNVCRRIRQRLQSIGLLIPTSDDYLIVADLPGAHAESKPLVVQPNFDITMPEEFSFADGLFVAGIGRLTRHDRYPHFELTKERLAAALRSGADIDETIDRLKSLAGGRVPQNVIVSMQSWAGEHESIRLFKGVVLTVERARRHAVEHSEAVRRLIKRELAPGIYLVDEQDLDSLKSALIDAGIELVPELATHPRDTDAAVPGIRRPPERPRLAAVTRVLKASIEGGAEPSRIGGTPAWLEEIRARLNDPSLTDEQRQELAGRVRQKLILTPDQIRGESLKPEKTEARGIDYVGKVRLIEQAIRTSSSLLEVIERAEDGAPLRRLVRPMELVKRGGELVLIGEELPDRAPIELLVRKLGLVRRLRSGLVRPR